MNTRAQGCYALFWSAIDVSAICLSFAFPPQYCLTKGVKFLFGDAVK